MRISYWISDVCSSDLDRPAREVMTPRTEVDWIDADADADAIRARLLESPHTRLPVAEGSVENIIGVVQARDIVSAQFRGQFLDRSEEHTSELQSLMRISYAVFCLKKKNNNKRVQKTQHHDSIQKNH